MCAGILICENDVYIAWNIKRRSQLFRWLLLSKLKTTWLLLAIIVVSIVASALKILAA